MQQTIEHSIEQAVVEAETPAPAQPPLAIFDRATLMERLEGDAELADEVVQIFLDECPKMMQRLREAVASAVAEAIQFSAHALKGAAANISAERVSAVALRLEIIGREGKLAGSQQEFSTLEAEVARLQHALRPVRRGQGV